MSCHLKLEMNIMWPDHVCDHKIEKLKIPRNERCWLDLVYYDTLKIWLLFENEHQISTALAGKKSLIDIGKQHLRTFKSKPPLQKEHFPSEPANNFDQRFVFVYFRFSKWSHNKIVVHVLFVCLFVCLFVGWLVCLFVCLFVCSFLFFPRWSPKTPRRCIFPCDTGRRPEELANFFWGGMVGVEFLTKNDPPWN